MNWVSAIGCVCVRLSLVLIFWITSTVSQIVEMGSTALFNLSSKLYQ